jgi:hypothetical protein
MASGLAGYFEETFIRMKKFLRFLSRGAFVVSATTLCQALRYLTLGDFYLGHLCGHRLDAVGPVPFLVIFRVTAGRGSRLRPGVPGPRSPDPGS